MDCGGDIACSQRDDMEKVLVDNGMTWRRTAPWCDLMQTLKMKTFFEISVVDNVTFCEFASKLKFNHSGIISIHCSL